MIKKISEGIKYQKLTEEEKKARGILGRLVGVCADFINPTRNGRGYTEQLWENVFNNPLMQEKIKNRVCYGELGHPAERAEIDPEKIAVCLAEQPVKNSNGQLEAVFDILDTPNGRILKALCDYGSTLGISSRGQGDLTTDDNGNEIVDPDTYECECWDIVLIPAVKEARLKYVTESLNNNNIKLKKALNEAFNKESEEGKKVMAETLKDLNISLTEEANKELSDKDIEKIVKDKQDSDAATANAVAQLQAQKAEIESKLASLGVTDNAPAEAPMDTTLDAPIEDAPLETALDTPVEDAPIEDAPVDNAPVDGGLDLGAGEDINTEEANDEQPTEENVEKEEEPKTESLNEANDKVFIDDDIADALYWINEDGYFDIYNYDSEKRVKEILAHFEPYMNGLEFGTADDNRGQGQPVRRGKAVTGDRTGNRQLAELEVVDTPDGNGKRIKVKGLNVEEAFDINVSDVNLSAPVDASGAAVGFLGGTANATNEEVEDEVAQLEVAEEPEEDTAETTEEETPTEQDEEISLETLKEVSTKLFEIIDSLTTDENAEEIQDQVAELQNDLELTDDQMAEVGCEVKDDEETSTEENSDDIDVEEDATEEADDETNEALDNGSKELVKNLQEALKTKSGLEKKVKSLQEELAVSDAKVNDMNEELEKSKQSIARLAQSSKTNLELQSTIARLEESLKEKEACIKDQELRIARLVKSKKESLEKDAQIKTLNESVNNGKAQLKTLNEQLTKKTTELTESLNKANTLKESYKKLAQQSMDMLIEEKAKQLGLTSKDVKRKLGSTYTIKDVVEVCEELKRYQLNVSKLPFSVGQRIGVKVNESIKSNKPVNAFDDDSVDDNLMAIANLSKR